MTTGLNGFHNLLQDFNKIAAWVLPTAGFSPIIASLAGLNPPWPNTIALTVATSTSVLFTLIVVYHFMDVKSRSLANIIIINGLIFGILSTVAYFVFFAFLVYKTPVTDEAFVKGFECTKDAQLLFPQKCPWLDLDELKSAEYEATRLWTLPSILFSRLILLFMWFSMFIMFSISLGAFVRYQSMNSRKNELS